MATLREAGIFDLVEARLGDIDNDASNLQTTLSGLYTDNSNNTEIRSLITRLRHAQLDAETVAEDIAYVLNKLTTADLLSDDE